ncbi:phospholipase A1-like [Diabrotica virgifera virgifera]|uniref:Lipase domain-containing protein n=1 Tax=Diabrotica virgifera virgifera TaxID=50390 RepID=A0ABM5IRZ8_DIAVI|nr:phospholipase A1-like [Diabrotica virgifera virgifera]
MVWTAKYNRHHLQEIYSEFDNEFLLYLANSAFGYYTDQKPEERNTSIIDEAEIGPLLDCSGLMTFTLFTRDSPGGWLVDDPDKLPNYLKKTEIKFVTHGWLSRGTAETCVEIKNAFLEKYDINVFVVDWSSITDNILYSVPAQGAPCIGEEYAKFINDLIEKFNVNPKDIHLIGHSLGAHVSGFAGRKVNKKISRITGLDPAAVGFQIMHINKNDADFVDIIHTAAGLVAVLEPIGHADFYPNGGTIPQPGCGILSVLNSCSHSRSWQLFAFSIKLDQQFIAHKCETLDDAFLSNCKGELFPMGYPTPPTARGIFYVKTSSVEPYIEP